MYKRIFVFVFAFLLNLSLLEANVSLDREVISVSCSAFCLPEYWGTPQEYPQAIRAAEIGAIKKAQEKLGVKYLYIWAKKVEPEKENFKSGEAVTVSLEVSSRPVISREKKPVLYFELNRVSEDRLKNREDGWRIVHLESGKITVLKLFFPGVPQMKIADKQILCKIIWNEDEKAVIAKIGEPYLSLVYELRDEIPREVVIETEDATNRVVLLRSKEDDEFAEKMKKEREQKINIIKKEIKWLDE